MLSKAELAVQLERFRQQGLTSTYIHLLLEEARSRRLHEMHYVRGNWQLVCAEWFDVETEWRKTR